MAPKRKRSEFLEDKEVKFACKMPQRPDRPSATLTLPNSDKGSSSLKTEESLVEEPKEKNVQFEESDTAYGQVKVTMQCFQMSDKEVTYCLSVTISIRCDGKTYGVWNRSYLEDAVRRGITKSISPPSPWIDISHHSNRFDFGTDSTMSEEEIIKTTKSIFDGLIEDFDSRGMILNKDYTIGYRIVKSLALVEY